MKIDNAEFIELLRQLREGLDRIGLRHRVEDAVRRYAIADAIGAPDIDDGFGDFERQPRAIFDPAAIDVGAFVAAVAGELIEQIAVRAVQLDAIEAGSLGILGISAELFDDAWKLGKRQGPQGHHLLRIFGGEHLSLCRCCRWFDQKRAAVEIRMRNASNMP